MEQLGGLGERPRSGPAGNRTGVARAFELAETGRGRRAYVAWLEARAANDGGKIDAQATAALKRGWYLGKETFKDRLLDLLAPNPVALGEGDASGAFH